MFSYVFNTQGLGDTATH